MAEYIEREAVLKAFDDDAEGSRYPPDPVDPYAWAEAFVKSVPAADVVEVVRCKDCKHIAKISGYCDAIRSHVSGEAQEEFFCAFGERREIRYD